MSENLNKNPYPDHEPESAKEAPKYQESEFTQSSDSDSSAPKPQETPQSPYSTTQGYNTPSTHNDSSSPYGQPQGSYTPQNPYGQPQYPNQNPQQGQYAPQGQYPQQGGYNQPPQGLYAAPQPGMAGYAPPLAPSTQKSNELAYWSLGIFGGGFVLSFMMLFWLVPITSIVGIVLSRKAQAYEQTSLATTSFWLNVAGLVLSLMASLAVFFFIFLIAASSGGNFH